MTYPDYRSREKEAMLLRDLEYLQQMYPHEIRRYQRRIAEILDRTDYEGSMIYDEYPDRCSVQALARSMSKILENEEESAPAEEVVQILLCDEIYKRRHGGCRGKFYSL
nr:hypothetical protein [uncultured Acetatifactor sp.]